MPYTNVTMRKLNDALIVSRYDGRRNRSGKMIACEKCGKVRWVALDNLSRSSVCRKCQRHPIRTSIYKICPTCGKSFLVIQARNRRVNFCSKACVRRTSYSDSFKARIHPPRPAMQKTCPVCHREFTTKREQSIYCSTRCMHLGKVSQIEKICLACGKSFKVIRSRSAEAKYCSHDCANAGARNPHFKHGIFIGGPGGHPYSGKWESTRERIKERDGHRCQFPGCRETKRLEVHHINTFDRNVPAELQNTDDNLVTLCHTHHRLVQQKVK